MIEISRKAVRAKMREFDAIGSKDFFKKYGGGPALRYYLVNPRKAATLYPPAAIAQAALSVDDIRGGRSGYDTANSVLERAGFTILDRETEEGAREIAIADLHMEYAKRIGALSSTEQKAIVARRIGQDLFRKELLRRSNHTCEVTSITDRKLIRASHIRPWSKCKDDRQKLDPENGIALSSLWDCAFDNGLVSFDDQGTPLFSEKLSNAAKSLLMSMTVSSVRVSEAKAKYLAYHRKHRFKL